MRRASSRAQITITGHAEEQALAPMEGWLKKHNHSGASMFVSEWSKRWCSINDERGRLHVGKKKGKEGTTVVRANHPRSPPRDAVVRHIRARSIYPRARRNIFSARAQPMFASWQFSLSEVTQIRALDPLSKESDGRMFSFIVSQPPLSLVLRCRNETERAKWVQALQQRAEIWKVRRAAEMSETFGMTVAVTMRSAGVSGKMSDAPGAANTGVTGSDDEPDENSDDETDDVASLS